MGYPEMAKMINDGIDPYTAVAKLVTQRDDITKHERQAWKVVFLSLMYGGGVRTIGAQISAWPDELRAAVNAPSDGTKFVGPEKQARRIVNTFHENFPAVRSLQDTVGRVSKRRGYITGIDGRHLHPEPYGEHKMLNKLIQGGAAGIMKQAIVTVHKWMQSDLDGEGDPIQSQIISVVHDELQIDGPVSELPMLNEWIPRLMVHAEVNEVVPITVDHEVTTTNWAEKVPYDEWKEAA